MVTEGLYFLEPYTESIIRSIKVDKLFYEGKTKHQFVQCFYNKFLGKVLFLDKKIQSAQIDEFIYHESLVQPGLLTHFDPQKVLIIGGGEGATLREVLRQRTVTEATMVDIDEELVQLCQKYLPEWSDGAFSNSKAHLIYSDARSFVEKTEKKFDIIISDLTEPMDAGPSVRLFTREFFERIFHALTEDGIFALQAGSIDSCFHQFYSSCVKTLENIFPVVRPYWTFVLSFGLPWGFVLASKSSDPLRLSEKEIAEKLCRRKVHNLRFYHSGLHRGLFALPLYLTKSFKRARVLTDEKPFIWEL